MISCIIGLSFLNHSLPISFFSESNSSAPTNDVVDINQNEENQQNQNDIKTKTHARSHSENETVFTCDTNPTENLSNQNHNEKVLQKPKQKLKPKPKSQSEISEIKRKILGLFPDLPDLKNVHQHDICKESCCTNVSPAEVERIRLKSNKKEKFDHKWLSTPDDTKDCNIIYIENQGFFCMLCKEHLKIDAAEKAVKFVTVPSVRVKSDAVSTHISSGPHKDAITTEMTKRCSPYQKKHMEDQENADIADRNTFNAVYWLLKNSIANEKATSIMSLLDKCDSPILGYSAKATFREISILISDVILQEILQDVKGAVTFSILVDDVTDVSSKEQMILFIEYYSRKEEKVVVKFIDITSILDNTTSTTLDADTLTEVLLDTLRKNGLNPEKVGSMCSDGAPVMLGIRNGVGKQLEKQNPHIIVIHCSCHNLALACAKYSGLTDKETKQLKYIETSLSYQTELWKMLSYSNVKMNIFVKKQLKLLGQNLLPGVKRKALKSIKKAVATRWISNEASVQSVAQNYLAILETLAEIQHKDPAAAGLLAHFNNSKFLCTLFIMKEVLPVTKEVC